jgi:hypothetical protein
MPSAGITLRLKIAEAQIHQYVNPGYNGITTNLRSVGRGKSKKWEEELKFHDASDS